MAQDKCSQNPYRTNVQAGQDDPERYYRKMLSKIRLFSGSKAEYESMVGYETEIIDAGRQEIGVTLTRNHYDSKEFLAGFNYFRSREDVSLRNFLVDEGIEVLVRREVLKYIESAINNAEINNVIFRVCGLPLRKKRKA